MSVFHFSIAMLITIPTVIDSRNLSPNPCLETTAYADRYAQSADVKITISLILTRILKSDIAVITIDVIQIATKIL